MTIENPSKERETASTSDNRDSLELNLDLLREQNYLAVDISMSVAERRALDNFPDIEEAMLDLDYYGESEEELRVMVERKLSDINNGNIETATIIAGIVVRLVGNFKTVMGQEAIWASLRMSPPNEDCTVPRWHVDGRYSETNEVPFKFVVSLKGPQTRFAKMINWDEFKKLSRQMETGLEMGIREKLVDTVEEIFPAEIGQGMIFRVGDDGAVVHSEPDATGSRIFLSVVAGKRKDVIEMQG